MEKLRRLADRITHPSYLGGLADRSIEELREMREAAREAENEISFERRMCQARMDILAAEVGRRSGGDDGDLVSRLPQILAPEGNAAKGPLPTRAPDLSVPRNVATPRRRGEDLLGDEILARLPEASSEELDAILGRLADHERALSARRRQIHEVMDRIQAQFVSALRAANPGALSVPDA
ncbi:MAG: hypothetical protein ABR575_01890 [Actinomycetota bacterium]